jgi:hypothetical protein
MPSVFIFIHQSSVVYIVCLLEATVSRDTVPSYLKIKKIFAPVLWDDCVIRVTDNKLDEQNSTPGRAGIFCLLPHPSLICIHAIGTMWHLASRVDHFPA